MSPSLSRVMVSHVLVPGNPRSKGRPRFAPTKNGKVRTYTPAATVAAEQEIGWIVKRDLADRNKSAFPDSDSDFIVEIRIYELKANGHQVDVDNASKLILDSLNQICWLDDRQVVELHAFMKDRDSNDPHTEITIYRLEAA